MRGKWISLGLIFGLTAGIAAAQAPLRTTVDISSMNCSGEISSAPISRDSYIISGESSVTKITFADHDLLYINRGADKGVNTGDQYRVIRPVHDELGVSWFHGQILLVRAAGQAWADLGIIKVVHVEAKTSTAELISNCAYVQRGDIIVPYADRPAPTLKPGAHLVDRFAPATGKTGMIITTKEFGQTVGNNSIVYVNLGSTQGVQVGSYLRIFRHQGQEDDVIYQTAGTEYKMYGFGSTPVAYTWPDLPRQMLGEGIVIRVSGNSATLMVTATRHEIYVGDYVEIE